MKRNGSFLMRKGIVNYVVNGDCWRNERNWFQKGSSIDIDSSLTKRDKYSLDFRSFNEEYCAPIFKNAEMWFNIRIRGERTSSIVNDGWMMRAYKHLTYTHPCGWLFMTSQILAKDLQCINVGYIQFDLKIWDLRDR